MTWNCVSTSRRGFALAVYVYPETRIRQIPSSTSFVHLNVIYHLYGGVCVVVVCVLDHARSIVGGCWWWWLFFCALFRIVNVCKRHCEWRGGGCCLENKWRIYILCICTITTGIGVWWGVCKANIYWHTSISNNIKCSNMGCNNYYLWNRYAVLVWLKFTRFTKTYRSGAQNEYLSRNINFAFYTSTHTFYFKRVFVFFFVEYFTSNLF